MSCYEARKRCPEAIFVRPRFAEYRAVSGQIRAIMKAVTPLVEPLSLDEAYLDVTGITAHQGSATLMANAIRADIFEQTGLTASAGVSFNKMLAKIASDLNKPNGTAVITLMRPTTLLPTCPSTVFMVSAKPAKRLTQMGITDGRTLREANVDDLVQAWQTGQVLS